MSDYDITSGNSIDGVTIETWRYMLVRSGGTANNTTVNPSGDLDIRQGGLVNNTMLCGQLNLDGGGTANSTTVNSNGRFYDAGMANSTIVNASGRMFVLFSGMANSTTVNSGGNMFVSSGGTANNTTVTPGGNMFVSSGGTANNTTVTPGGNLSVSSGGTATNVTAEAGADLSFVVAPDTYIQGSYHDSAFEIKDAFLSDYTVYSASNLSVSGGGRGNNITVSSDGKFYVCDGGTANGATVISGGSMIVSGGGIANSATVISGGRIFISSEGSATDITVASGGYLYVSGGGTATGIIWTPCEGYVYVFGEAAATFVSQYSGVYYGSDNHLLSNAAVMDSMTLRQKDEMNVMSEGTANDITVSSGGRIFISSGGMVNSTTVSSGGIMYVSGGGTVNTPSISSGKLYLYGGTANSATVISGGSVIVSSGGIANSTTVNSLGHLDVFSGGTANSTTLTSRSSMFVYSGGKHTGRLTVLSGAYVSFWTDAILDLDLTQTVAGNTALVNNFSLLNGSPSYTVTVSPDQAAGIYSLADSAENFAGTITVQNTEGEALGTLALGKTIEIAGVSYTLFKTCGDLSLAVGCDPLQTSVVNGTVLTDETKTVNSGEAYYNTIISSGGKLIVSSGGTANLFTISSGGTIEVSSGGSVKRGGISKGELIVHSSARVNNATIFYRGNLFVSGGFVDNTEIRFGNMYVSAGGIADHTVVSSSGKFLVSSGGLAENTSVYFWGSTIVSSGATANSTTVFVYGLLAVDGYACDTILSSGGWVTVYSGGVVNSTVVISSGGFTVSDGGKAYNTIVSSGGSITVCAGATATDLALCSGASYAFTIASGAFIEGTYAGSAFEIKDGSVSDYTIHSGGALIVASDCKADNTVVSAGGCIIVSSGGTATDLTMCDGASYAFEISSDTFIEGTSSGLAFEIKNGLASNCIVKSGDRLKIYSGGTAYNTRIAGGSFTLLRDTVASGVVIDHGGRITVASGGTANEVIVSDGCFDITSAAANNVTVASGSFNVNIGAIVNSVIVFSRGQFNVNNATVNSTVVSSGGQLFVFDRGNVNDVIVSSGAQLDLTNSAIAKNITLLSGHISISSNAAASSTVVSSGGRITVSSGGTANDTTVNSGARLIIGSGGTAKSTTVSAGGVMKIESGGKPDTVTVQNGGKLQGFFDCSDVTFDPGATVYFDISGIAPENTDAIVKITSLSDLDNNPFSLLVSDSQEAGVYKLAEGAQGFDRTISVVNSVMEFGSLSLDQSVEVNGREYTLDLTDGDLMLNVSAPIAQYVYLDFDGEDMVRYTNSDLELSFDLSVSDPGFSEEQRQAIVSALSETYHKDNIAFTLERPEDVDYSTLYFGLSSAFDGYGDFFGVAETHDGNNRNQNDNAFILLDQSYSDGQIISTASRMLDHLLGISCFAEGTQALRKYAENKTLLSLSTGWHQEDPYNKYCPVDPRTGTRSLTGCTNNAASQIIYYWLEKGMLDFTLSLEDKDAFVSNKYITIDSSDTPAAGHLSFTEVNQLLQDFKLGDEDCIAALCFAAGVIQQADYSTASTSTPWSSNLFVRAGFEDTATYRTMYLVNWPTMSDSYQDANTRLADDDFLVRELLAGRPVGITIRSIHHAIVLDGYDSSRNMFHLNFGWGGPSNDWYTIEDLISFQIGESVYGITPIIFPDLTVENLSVDARSVNLNEDVTLSFTVSNEGTEVSTDTFAYVYCGDTLIDAIGMTYISPGYSREFSCTIDAASLPVGEIDLTVKVFSQKDEDSFSSATVTVHHSDDPAPRKPAVSADITAPTKEDVLVSAEFSRNAVTKEYGFDGETWSAYTGPVRVTENGAVFFRCADDAGHISDIASYEVTNIDKAPPVITLIGDTQTPLRQSMVTALVDDGSKIFYRIGDSEGWTEYTGSITVSTNAAYFFKATDAAGNTGNTEIVFANIDKEPPVITLTGDTSTPLQVGALSASTEAGLVIYVSTDNATWTKYEGELAVTANGAYYFKAEDAAGNTGLASITFGNIDKVAPTDPTGLQAVVSEQTVALTWTVSADDLSGVKEYVVTYSLDGQVFTARTNGTCLVLNGIDVGAWNWSVQAVDFAGNESAATAGDAFTVIGFKPYVVEYSSDNFEHVIRFTVTSPTLDSFRMPGGTYQLRVRAEDGSEWQTDDSIVADELDKAPQLIRSDADGNADVFFANAVGVWETGFLSQHVGSVNDWSGTGEYVAVFGRNKLADIFEGSTDANILLLTDDPNGDALFVDDIYTASPENIAETQSRIAQIDEIRAGAGNDLVDMTSQQFEYIGNGLTIRGGEGDDTIWANKGSNILFGDAGNDRIVGASGNDLIAGGAGNDRMHGGGGSDVFTFCENWGVDNVEQLASGTVTLWFASGDESKWDEATLTYTDGENSVRVSGVTADRIALKFGDDGSDRFAALSSAGAFFDATTERIFEESGKGILASL